MNVKHYFHCSLSVASIKLVIILFVIVCGCLKLNFSNWSIETVKVPQGFGDGGFFPFGILGVVRGAAICFFGFIGFDIIASASEEVKNPKRAIPLSICLSLFISFLAYTGVSTVLTLMVPYYELVREIIIQWHQLITFRRINTRHSLKCLTALVGQLLSTLCRSDQFSDCFHAWLDWFSLCQEFSMQWRKMDFCLASSQQFIQSLKRRLGEFWSLAF